MVTLKKSNKGQKLYQKAKTLIPGGTQLLSKRPEMFAPESWPVYYSRAQGVNVWDLEGNHFIDMSYSAIGACILGYADSDVNRAVQKAVQSGSMCTLNCAEEVELAQLLCQIHPWAQMVRLARTGGEAVAIAVRIARAFTGKEKIAFCGYHGWHDWYLAANLSSDDNLNGHLLSGLSAAGVPKGLKGTAIPFHYNQVDEFKNLISQCGQELAAIIMEPARHEHPQKGFLEAVRQAADTAKAVLIFDEVSSGFRMNLGGLHLVYGIKPDLAVFGKSLGNGYPIAAVIGKEKVMQAAQRSFISSTSWTERIGPSAALAVIRKYKRVSAHKHLIKIGQLVQDGWKKSAQEASLNIKVKGLPPMGTFSFEYANPQLLKTLFVQRMLEHGILATNAFYSSFAHKEHHVRKYLNCVQDSFHYISRALKEDNVESLIKGEAAHQGFQRLN